MIKSLKFWLLITTELIYTYGLRCQPLRFRVLNNKNITEIKEKNSLTYIQVFCAMTNKCTIMSQIITLLHVSTWAR